MMASLEMLGYRFEQPVQQRADKNKAKPLMALKANIVFFNLTQYVATNCLSTVDQQYFGSTQAATRSLHDLAILQSCPAVRVLPVFDNQHAELITKTIVAGKGVHVKAIMLEKLQKGSCS